MTKPGVFSRLGRFSKPGRERCKLSHRHFASPVELFHVAAKQILLGVLLTVCLLVPAGTAHAYGINECAASRMGSDLGCTAGDVSITGIAVAPGSPTSCVGGTTFTVDLDITVNFATPDRWDIGIFLSNDGNNPQTLPVNGGAATCNVGILPTMSPFLDLDPNGGLDTCGDGNGAINGGTGSGIVRMEDVPVSCQAINLSGGNLYIPFVVSWDNQSSPSGSNCTSIADPVPNTVSKCNAPKTTVATEVAYGTVNAVVLPAITKTDGITDITPGSTTTYSVVITNTTGVSLSNAVFTDPAAANLTVNTVSCSAAGGATCPAISVAAMQGAGVTIPPMPVDSSVTFTIDATVVDTVDPAYTHLITNTATVTVGPTGNRKSNSASDSDNLVAAVYSDLSTSTKTVLDQNGGEADPGDVLRYTITLQETAGLIATNGITVTDNIPPYISSFSVVSFPPGATNASTGPGTGSNNTGYLNITGIDLAAGGSANIVFDITIAAGTPAGTRIDNVATVTNPTGPGGTPTAPPVTVSPSAVQYTDNKQLYLYSTAPNTLSRNKPSGTPANVTLGKTFATWNGNSPQPLQLNNTIASAYATLFLTADTTQSRQVEARLYCSATPSAYATSGTYDLGTVPATPTQYTFNLTTTLGGFGFPATCTAPNYWVLRVENFTNQNTTIVPVSGLDHSRVNLASSNVIDVSSLAFYNAPYPGGTAVTAFVPGSTIYVRASVNDPFGSFDITSARIDITDPTGAKLVDAIAMSVPVGGDSGAASKTFEFSYTIPSGGVSGNWTVKVTAYEGSEGTVSDDRIAAFSVYNPPGNVTLVKLKHNVGPTGYDIPGETVRYSLIVTNFDSRAIDSGSLELVDPIPANTALVAIDPVVTIANDPSVTGLTLTYSGLSVATDQVEFSTDGSDFSYQPVNSGGIDPNVKYIRFVPTGSMNGASGSSNPSFTATFKVRIQ